MRHLASQGLFGVISIITNSISTQMAAPKCRYDADSARAYLGTIAHLVDASVTNPEYLPRDSEHLMVTF